MKFQIYRSMLLLVVLGEFIEFRKAHKSIRPYKYYRTIPRGHKPRWHQFPRPSRYRHFRKGPSKPHLCRPNGAWNGPCYAMDHNGNEESYTIEIKLPKRQRGYSQINDRYHKNYIRGVTDDFYADDDYLDENEFFESKVLRFGKKRAVKAVKPKLTIQISRLDKPTAVTGSVISPIGGDRLPTDSSLSIKKIEETIHRKWIPGYPVPSFPKALRRV